MEDESTTSRANISEFFGTSELISRAFNVSALAFFATLLKHFVTGVIEPLYSDGISTVNSKGHTAFSAH